MTKRSTQRKVLTAIADTLEGMGVREVVSLIGPEPVDRASIKEAFDAVVRELRAQASAVYVCQAKRKGHRCVLPAKHEAPHEWCVVSRRR